MEICAKYEYVAQKYEEERITSPIIIDLCIALSGKLKEKGSGVEGALLRKKDEQ